MSNGVSECSCRRINWKCPTVIRILDQHLIHNHSNDETLKLLHEHTSVLCSNSVFRKHVATRRRELFSKEEHVNLQYIMDNVAKEHSKDGIKLVAEKRPAAHPPDFNVVESIDTTVAEYWKRRRLEQDCKFLETAADLSIQCSNAATSPAVLAETRHIHPKIDDGDSSSKVHQNSSHGPSVKMHPATPSQKSLHSDPKADNTSLFKLNQQNVKHTTSNYLLTTTPPAMPPQMVASHSKISDCALSSSPKSGLLNNSHGVPPSFIATVNHPLTVSHSFSTSPKINDGASSSKVQKHSHEKPPNCTQTSMMNRVASLSKPLAPPAASQSFTPYLKINHGASLPTDPLKFPSKPFYNPPRRFVLDEAERIRFSELIRKNAHFVEAPPNMPIVKNLLDHFRNS